MVFTFHKLILAGGGTFQNPKMAGGIPTWKSNLPPILPQWLWKDYESDQSGGARSMREKCDTMALKVEQLLQGGPSFSHN